MIKIFKREMAAIGAIIVFVLALGIISLEYAYAEILPPTSGTPQAMTPHQSVFTQAEMDGFQCLYTTMSTLALPSRHKDEIAVGALEIVDLPHLHAGYDRLTGLQMR